MCNTYAKQTKTAIRIGNCIDKHQNLMVFENDAICHL